MQVDCPLTSRELSCVKGLAEGHTMAEIAVIENRTRDAIDTRIKHAREKVCAKTAANLVAIALRSGWIQ